MRTGQKTIGVLGTANVIWMLVNMITFKTLVGLDEKMFMIRTVSSKVASHCCV